MPKSKLTPQIIKELQELYYDLYIPSLTIAKMQKYSMFSNKTISKTLKNNPEILPNTINEMNICIGNNKVINDLSKYGITCNSYVKRTVWRINQSYDLTETGCFEWNKSFHSEGRYGVIELQRVSDGVIGLAVSVHQIVYHLCIGEILDSNLVVRHKCDNSICCNPKHLMIGTLKDNTLDMIISQRMGGNSTTNEQKLEMVEMRNAGLELKEISNKFDVSVSCVSRILGGKRKTVHLGIGIHELSYTTRRSAPPKITKLTGTQVLEIIEYWNYGYSMKSISEKYNVGRTTISDIINRRTWIYFTRNLEIRKYKG